jgi:methyl-accepting chemotaxis protein
MDSGYRELVESSVGGRKALTDVNAKVQEIMDSSVNLREANSLIAKIAAQTSLLAMNAAIEAAHAGEYGRGFSVVADEIRKLADNATDQSKSTSQMLKKIENAILTASEASKTADLTMQGFMEKLDTIALLERQIETAMKEQSVGSNQILETLTTIHTTTRSVQESNAAINEHNKRITHDINDLYQISTEIHHSMDEISQGANEINEAVTIISDMSVKNREVIEGVNAGISRFKTSDSR